MKRYFLSLLLVLWTSCSWAFPPGFIGVIGGGGAATFDPASLYIGGYKGYWYDPSDFSTMFQDEAGTTPVTSTGQSVCRINDKSGNALNATQTTTSKCPVLGESGGKYYLVFDGSDVLVTPSINLSSGALATSVLGVKFTSASDILVAEFSASTNSNPKAFYALSTSSGKCVTGAAATTGFSVDSTETIGTQCSNGSTIVMTSSINNSEALAINRCKIRVNGSVPTTQTAQDGATTTNTFGNYPFYIGGRGVTPTSGFIGNLYAIIIVMKTSSTDELNGTESYINSKTGAY